MQNTSTHPLIRYEAIFTFILGLFLYGESGYSWWLFLALFFTPDIGMLGYLVNTKVGAITYNLLHFKGLGIVLYLLGMVIYEEAFVIAGLVIYTHSCFDRIVGYGLKYNDSFSHTHLGWIGKRKS